MWRWLHDFSWRIHTCWWTLSSRKGCCCICGSPHSGVCCVSLDGPAALKGIRNITVWPHFHSAFWALGLEYCPAHPNGTAPSPLFIHRTDCVLQGMWLSILAMGGGGEELCDLVEGTMHRDCTVCEQTIKKHLKGKLFRCFKYQLVFNKKLTSIMYYVSSSSRFLN